MTWHVVSQPLSADLHHNRPTRDGKPVSRGAFLEGLRDDPDLGLALSQALSERPWSAFRWETPPVTRGTLDLPAEFVTVASTGLSRPPDRDAFAAWFRKDAVVTFPNLGRDAVLVVPCPQAPDPVYVHLGSFVRGAPQAQQIALWQAVGRAMAQRLSDKPVWLSTAGAGVAWLHVRLDDRPKYYHHRPYTTAI